MEEVRALFEKQNYSKDVGQDIVKAFNATKDFGKVADLSTSSGKWLLERQPL